MRPAYTVIWKPSVIERTLAEFVVRALEDGSGSAAITSAMADLDIDLSTRPAEVGESRSGIRRIHIVEPLTVTYEVHEGDRIVYVLGASYRPRRPAR